MLSRKPMRIVKSADKCQRGESRALGKESLRGSITRKGLFEEKKKRKEGKESLLSLETHPPARGGAGNLFTINEDKRGKYDNFHPVYGGVKEGKEKKKGKGENGFSRGGRAEK